MCSSGSRLLITFAFLSSVLAPVGQRPSSRTQTVRLGPRMFFTSGLVSGRAFGLYEGPGIWSHELRPMSILLDHFIHSLKTILYSL